MSLTRLLFPTLADFWEQEQDPLTSTLWLVQDPILVLAFMVSLIGFIHFVAPSMSDGMNKTDLRPAMLITDGLIFGLLGIGLGCGLAASDMGRISFDCNLDPREYQHHPFHPDTIGIMSIKLIAYIFMILKVAEFHRPLYAHWRGEAGSPLYKSKGYTFYLFGQCLVTYLGLALYPGGMFALWCVTDAMATIGSYGYIILNTGSSELRMENTATRWTLVLMRLGQMVMMTAHGLYFSQVPACSRKPVLGNLLLLEGVFSLICAIAMVHSIIFGGLNTGSTRSKTQCLKGDENHNLKVQ